VPVLSSVIYCI